MENEIRKVVGEYDISDNTKKFLANDIIDLSNTKLTEAKARSTVEAGVILQIADTMKRSEIIKQMFDNNFWDLHTIDVGYRRDGEEYYEEADWLKDLWYLVKSNLSK